MFRLPITIPLLVMVSVLILPAKAGAENSDTWSGIASGEYVVLMRHALAPGTGDPVGFEPGNCATQRNLSAAGKEQAVRIGNLFRSNGISRARVWSSEWCRCIETAELLNLEEVEPLPLINSFYQAFDRREKQTGALREWLAVRRLPEPRVLVTHQVNISALTNSFTPSGGIVVIAIEKDSTIRLVDKINVEPPSTAAE